jgi:hypothetical protein
MPFGAAIAAGVGAVGAIGGSLISSSAAKSAANTQAAAANRAADAAQQQQAQVRSDLSPYRDAGQTGVDALLASLGLGGTGTNLLAANGINSLTFPQAPFPQFNPTTEALRATPGYQFTLGQGLQGVASSNAAAGRGISGAALKGAANYATGLADNTLNTQANIYKMNQGIYGMNQGIFQNNLQNVIGPLANLTNLGENASNQTGQNSLQSVGQSNAALQSAAASQAAGTVGSANAISGGLQTAANVPLNTLLFQKLLTSNNSGGSGFNSPLAFGGTSTPQIGSDTTAVGQGFF